MRFLRLASVVLVSCQLLPGCRKQPAETSPEDSRLSENTKILQAADLIGADGTQLRKTAGKLKEATDRHNQQIENAMGNGE